MRTERGTPVHLDIPFYRQHYDFTCGPASLMMAMKYFDPGLQLGKELEIDLWREGTLVTVYGTSRFGLAYSAMIRGFRALVTSSTGRVDFVEQYVPPLNDADMQTLMYHFFERRARCRGLGVRERQETITGETLKNSLHRDHVPLIVTNSVFFNGENLPHWVVVTGVDDRYLYLNNSLDIRARKRKVRLSDLPDFIGYRGDQSMVEIWRE